MNLFRFLNSLTLENGESYGKALDDWQREDFKTLESGISGAYLGRPRGHSKTLDLAAYALHHITTTEGARAYTFATDHDQARLIRDSAAGFVRRNATLRESVDVQRSVVQIEETDSRLEIWASDAPSSWGLRPSLVILDELSQWRGLASEELFEAAFSSTGKVEGCQLLIGTTAGWDRNSLCYRIRGLARESDDWYFSERPQCASWIDPDFLRRQASILPTHRYEMLHENKWTEGGGEWLTWEEIDSIFQEGLTEQSERGGPTTEGGRRPKYYIGVDLATSRDRTAVAVTRAEDDDLTVEKIVTWQGTQKERVQLSEVEAALIDLGERFNVKEIVLDPYQGVLLGQRLQQTGLDVHEYAFTSPSRAALFETLLQLIRQEKLHSYGHPTFREELNGLRWVEKNGILRPDHPTSGHDDTVVAVALAATRAIEQGARRSSGLKARTLGVGSGARVAQDIRAGLG